MKKLYIDKTENTGCFSVFVKDAEVNWVGATVYSMPIKHKNSEYQRYATNYDINFIFDDNIPEIDFVEKFFRDEEDCECEVLSYDNVSCDQFDGYLKKVVDFSFEKKESYNLGQNTFCSFYNKIRMFKINLWGTICYLASVKKGVTLIVKSVT